MKPIPEHLALFSWYAGHMAYLQSRGYVPRHDPAGAEARMADLRGARLYRADLREADFRGADLSEADLRGADLSGADLTWADLRDADFRGADLPGADLAAAAALGLLPEREAIIAILGGVAAFLEEADLEEADLEGTNLRGANLEVLDVSHPGVDEHEFEPGIDNLRD